MRLLSRRALSVAELASRLRERGFSEKEVSCELRRLKRAGLLADLELARILVRRRLESGHGRLAAKATLRQRQVEAPAIERALRELDQEIEEKALVKALEKALNLYADIPASQRRGKVVRYLASRGFPLALCLQATANLGGEIEDVDQLGESEDPEDFS
ncbi:MAG: regulatory protein RecX [Thermoanaerobaculaceae bacterium]